MRELYGLGFSAFVALYFGWLPVAQAENLVAHNYNGVWEQGRENKIAGMLNTSVLNEPTRDQLLNRIHSSTNNTVIYINTHISGKTVPGAMFLGHGTPYNPWVPESQLGADYVKPGDVKSKLDADSAPRLVVMAGCDALKYPWVDAFGAKTFISSKEDVWGAAPPGVIARDASSAAASTSAVSGRGRSSCSRTRHRS